MAEASPALQWAMCLAGGKPGLFFSSLIIASGHLYLKFMVPAYLRVSEPVVSNDGGSAASLVRGAQQNMY